MRKIAVFVLLMVSVVTASFVAAQDMPPLPGEEIVANLESPRGIALDDDGNLWVAIAGTGGDVAFTTLLGGEEFPLAAGMTGKIIMVSPDGTTTDVITGLPSYSSPTETTGIYRVIPHDDSLWLVMNGMGEKEVGHFWMNTIVEIDRETLVTRNVINLQGAELDGNPDGLEYNSNLSDIAWGADGTLYIVDAGGNALYSWTQADGLALVQAWEGNPVPDAIEIDENGDIYIGFLGQGLAPGAGYIEHWSNGEVVATYEGLNAVTDILVDGEDIYAVQLVVFTDAGPGPGSVARINADGQSLVVDGLVAPHSIAMDDEGALYVTYGTIAFAPGMTGGVVRVAPGE